MKKSQIVANIITGLVLLGLLAVQIVYYFQPKTVGQETEYSRGITVSMVAFTVTFIVLIMVTLAIYATKALLERQVKEKMAPVMDKATKAIKKVTLMGAPELEEPELTAVISAAILQFEADTSAKPVGLDFIVKSLAPAASSWKTQNLEDYGKTW